ncbi:hypothetical protein M011DRAFT_476191 [Sporormia fimetaria CBS 119925]|uniref:Extracellular membrane protein CFEM domain-containing protein n=1 Tax=Sporormia fimetaria CBS 119925 TaxID=1340428 RepID=A0A6A6VE19_9PLEO|nr:hypothetical protein M011DRAFT_476191 [Sporormia fimetaria CBS 119925]
MRSLNPTTFLFTLLSVVTLTSATDSVSLSSFKGKVRDLPEDCQEVYTSPIPSCKIEDFEPGAVCSTACVRSLSKLVETVSTACAGVEAPERTILRLFLDGLGLKALCPKVEVISSTSEVRTSTSRPTMTEAPESSATETETEEASSTTSSSSTLLAIDTAVPTTLTTAPPNLNQDSSSPPPAAQPTSSISFQKSNQDSGGGSPFDIQATGSSEDRTALRSLVGIMAAMLGGVIAAW